MFPAEVEFNKVGAGPVIFHPLESGELTLCIANDMISLPRTDLISQGLCIDQTVISSISDIQSTFLYKQHLLVATEYEVKLYCVRPWKEKKTLFQSSDIVRSLALQNDGYVAIGTDSNVINIFNISNPTYAVQLNGHKNAVAGLEFSPDGQILMSVSCDGTMRVWAKSMKGDTWDCIHSFSTIIKKFRPEEHRFPFAWNPTGLYACVANADGDVEVVENITWDTKLKIKTQGEVVKMEFSPNGLYLVILEGKILSCWKLFEGRPTLARREKHSTNLIGVSWHPKKNDLIMVS
jgi:WD40 repeat protein